MRWRQGFVCAVLAGAMALAGWAQTSLSYPQLRSLLRSSIDQRHSDKDISRYLKDQRLSFALTAVAVEEFQGWGIGPRTLEILRQLQADSASMPPPTVVQEESTEPEQPPPPSPEEQKRILAEARRAALDYDQSLPDFICLQLTRRYLDPTGLELDWLKMDEIKTRVSYFDHHENYELVSVDNRLTNKSMQDLGGATSTGEFGSILASLFALSAKADFRWARHSLLRARPVYVFEFTVERQYSSWRISSVGQETTKEIVAGYSGLVYIDKEFERVLRIYMDADTPPNFPIRQAQTRLDYDFIDISGRNYLLPLKARIRMRDGRYLSRNDVEFRLYRKFSTEATISFGEIDDLEPLPDEEAPQ